MKKHLNICIEIEETIGKLYRTMAGSPQLTPRVRTTLLELATDEDSHASQLRFALRFPDGTVLTSLPKMLSTAESLKQQINQFLSKNNLEQVTDKQALRIGVELEKRFQEVHIANSFDFKEQKLKDMFSAMALEDERHYRRLLELQKTLD